MNESEDSYSDEYIDGYCTGIELAKRDIVANQRMAPDDLCSCLNVHPRSEFGLGLRDGHSDHFIEQECTTISKSSSELEIS